MTAAETSATRQSAGSVLMIRPTAFARNDVTAPTNHFQTGAASVETDLIARTAVAEFNAVVAALVARGIDVQLFEGRTLTHLPDEIFPNNWISMHADGTVVLYPILAWNRRDERRRDIVDGLQQTQQGFRIERIIDLSVLEKKNHFLEGTGSLVLDRREQFVYACRSPRTHAEALHVFTRKLDYRPVFFDALDENRQPIYHTNVMLSIGTDFAVACLDCIPDIKDRYRVLRRLEESGREVISITMQQVREFAGNLLELEASGQRLIVMSARALRSLSDNQRQALQRHGEPVVVNVGTIERFGGGGVRCMLAENFLPPKMRR